MKSEMNMDMMAEMQDDLQDMMAEVDMDDHLEDLKMSSNSLNKGNMFSSGNGLVA